MYYPYFNLPLNYTATINPDGTADISGRLPFGITIILVISIISYIISLNWLYVGLGIFIAFFVFMKTKRDSELVIYDLEEILARPKI